MWLYDNINMCSYEVLEKSYNEVYTSMITGWANAKIEDHSDIMFKEDPQEFELVIKDSTLVEENNLIRFIAKKFSLEDDIICQSEWLTPTDSWYTGKIYLWIRRAALEIVLEKMCFKL